MWGYCLANLSSLCSVESYQHFHFIKLKKNSLSKDNSFHTHKNCDIMKLERKILLIYKNFYSTTKFPWWNYLVSKKFSLGEYQKYIHFVKLLSISFPLLQTFPLPLLWKITNIFIFASYYDSEWVSCFICPSQWKENLLQVGRYGCLRN